MSNIILPYHNGECFKAYLREVDFGKGRDIDKTNRLLVEMSLEGRDKRGR